MNKEDLELAKQYLKERSIDTSKVNDELMQQCISIVPLSEIEAVLGMVVQGEFLTFYKNYRQTNRRDYISTDAQCDSAK